MALVQVLHAITDDARYTLGYKHIGAEPEHFGSGQQGTRHVLEAAGPDDIASLLRELLTGTGSVRAEAPTKYVFDQRLTDLERWLLHDGWSVVDGDLRRLGAEVEDVVEVRDALLELLESSALDEDGAIRERVEESAEDLFSEHPDYNGSGTNARVALETLVRRLAANIATKTGGEAPQDRWGDALAYLRSVEVFDKDEEAAFATLYTFVSDAAHVPLTDEEWARLARTFMLSSCYYLLKKVDE